MSVAVHFEDAEKQTHASLLAMWVFIASESMFFAALFGLYGALRAAHRDGFSRGAQASALALGTANTVILLASSLAAALAVDAVRRGRSPRVFLASTILLGLGFLAVKGVEYARHLAEGIRPGAGGASPGEQAFFDLYYLMTGLHALHVAAGIGVIGWLVKRASTFGPEEHIPLELGTLYWHFVDAIWLFLWPLFYLIR